MIAYELHTRQRFLTGMYKNAGLGFSYPYPVDEWAVAAATQGARQGLSSRPLSGSTLHTLCGIRWWRHGQ